MYLEEQILLVEMVDINFCTRTTVPVGSVARILKVIVNCTTSLISSAGKGTSSPEG